MSPHSYDYVGIFAHDVCEHVSSHRKIHTAKRCSSPPAHVLWLPINAIFRSYTTKISEEEPPHRAAVGPIVSIIKSLIVDLESPLDFRLIVEANHEVGHELEEVLPQAQEEVQVEVADVYLAVYPRVIDVAHTLKIVHIVDAEASVHTRV